MAEEYSLVDTSKLLQAASDFSFDPGSLLCLQITSDFCFNSYLS
jgi:hypothetical protein